MLNCGGWSVDGCYAGGSRVAPSVEVGQAISISLDMRPVGRVAGAAVVEDALAAIWIVLAMLILVVADGQDRVARRWSAWSKGGGIVWLVVLAVMAVVSLLVVRSGLRCAATEHYGIDCGSCVWFVFSA